MAQTTKINSYKLSHAERNERADDLIAMLSGFDIPYLDARTIASIIYQKMVGMGADDYARKGGDVNALVGMLDKRDGIDTAASRQRTFHEPLERDD